MLAHTRHLEPQPWTLPKHLLPRLMTFLEPYFEINKGKALIKFLCYAVRPLKWYVA